MKWVISENSLKERKEMGREFTAEQMKNIKVLPQAEIEQMNDEDIFLFCNDKRNTPDCVQGSCYDCGHVIFYQPDNERIKRKLCERCTGTVVGHG